MLIPVNVRKLLRFIGIYGPGRTLFKAAGRLRLRLPSWGSRGRAKDIGIVGCGQFAFATIGYFLTRRFGRRVLGCFDIDAQAAATLARGLGVPHVCRDVQALLGLPGLRTAYIASNHATHAAYAELALGMGLDVYVEKPVAVDLAQLARLERARRFSKCQLFAGYNRPFSAALRDMRQHVRIDPAAGMSLQCFVAGHVLGADHWYRRPEEGTRICGNVGHWLDLFVHLMSWRGMPDRLEIALTWARADERDDNLSISMASDRSDLFSIMLTARAEPFEGINESIQFQHADTTCKIDDFRTLTLWQGPRLLKRRYWPKDPGHGNAIYQPFATGAGRAWQEVVDSTLLMLHVTTMVRTATRVSTFSLHDARRTLDLAVDTL